MGPEPKDALIAPDELERMRQETEGILATTARLMKEMQELLDRAEKLGQSHDALIAKVRKERQ